MPYILTRFHSMSNEGVGFLLPNVYYFLCAKQESNKLYEPHLALKGYQLVKWKMLSNGI